MAALIAVAAQIAASKAAADAHIASGEAAAESKEAQAESAESAAKDRELERLIELRKVRAAQRAYWAAAGIDPATGSPTVVADRSYDMFTLDQGADLINTRQQIRTFNNEAASARKIGRIKAKGSMLTGLTSAANTWNT